MKKTSPKSLEAQQKVFALLAAPSRIRVLNQLMATPNLTLTEIHKRTGLTLSTAHSALKQLNEAKMLRFNVGNRYSIEDTAVMNLTNLCEDATDLRHLLTRVKTKKARATVTSPQLRAI